MESWSKVLKLRLNDNQPWGHLWSAPSIPWPIFNQFVPNLNTYNIRLAPSRYPSMKNEVDNKQKIDTLAVPSVAEFDGCSKWSWQRSR
jgi:hypothetical protein